MDLLELIWDGLIDQGWLVPNSMQTARRLRLAWSLVALVATALASMTGHAAAGVLAAPVAAWTFLFGLVDLLKEWPESWLSGLTVVCSAAAIVLLVLWA